MHRYFITLAFNGKNYHGWQVQPNAPSIQQHMEQALSLLLSETIAVTGAGRTDAGVHASHFVAHFDVEKKISDAQLVFKLNRFLPPGIAVFNIYKVQADRHARFDAISRTYEYRIVQHKNPFYLDFAYYLYGQLDMEKMNNAAAILYDYYDYTSFSKVHTDVKTNRCTVKKALFTADKDRLIFTITADRFLRNMVRAIAGTLIDVGFGKISVEGFRAIIESKDRGKAGASAPAKGLYLTAIAYPYDYKHDI